MRRALALGAAGFLLAALCAGCIEPPDVVFTNNAGATVVLRVADEPSRAMPPVDSVVQLKQGQSRRFPEGYTARLGIQVVTANCLIRYDLPKFVLDPGEPAETYPLRVQLEPDMKVYWVERGSGAGGKIGRPRAVQKHGFPMAPTWSACHAVADTSKARAAESK